MARKFLLFFFLILAVVYVPASYSQNPPTFTCNLYNPTWDAAKVIEFDIYVCNTGTDYMEIGVMQFGITYNSAVKSTGTIAISWVAGSQTDLVASEQGCALNAATAGVLKIAAKTPSGNGSGTQVDGAVHGTNNYPGIRVGRIHLANSVNFTQLNMGCDFNMTTNPYLTAFTCYVNGQSINATAGGTFGVDPALPVELSTFTSNVNGRQVNLNWDTKTEVNSSKYEVERSLGSTTTWATVGSLQAAGTSNSPKKYSYTDKNLQSGKYQYRLKMIDNDGSFKYSKVEAAEISVPKDFALSQNYPNPFNPTTKINYQVPVDAKVILEVYNITGQKVSELVNQDMSAGYYTADFGSTKLSSGVYIYRMVASDRATGNNFSSIKKMMLLK